MLAFGISRASSCLSSNWDYDLAIVEQNSSKFVTLRTKRRSHFAESFGFYLVISLRNISSHKKVINCDSDVIKVSYNSKIVQFLVLVKNLVELLKDEILVTF